MGLKVIVLIACLLPVVAVANLPELPKKDGIGLVSSDTDSYRLGDEWGKRPVTAAELETARPAFRRAALATAQVGGATGFYLGTFGGAHLIATNHHVYPQIADCTQRVIRFPLLGVRAFCQKILGSWDSIDLALFTVRFASEEDAAKAASVAANFQFNRDVVAGQPLLTIGFGVAGNFGRQMMANEDSDCYVFSGEGEYRQMADPDRLNPGSYRAWSFALGCDVSHGDSGSAIVDRASGQVVGIIWTGRIPKSAAAQSTLELNKMFRERSERVWEELSYAVPARKIGDHFRQLLEGNLPADTRLILQSMLQQ